MDHLANDECLTMDQSSPENKSRLDRNDGLASGLDPVLETVGSTTNQAEGGYTVWVLFGLTNCATQWCRAISRMADVGLAPAAVAGVRPLLEAVAWGLWVSGGGDKYEREERAVHFVRNEQLERLSHCNAWADNRKRYGDGKDVLRRDVLTSTATDSVRDAHNRNPCKELNNLETLCTTVGLRDAYETAGRQASLRIHTTFLFPYIGAEREPPYRAATATDEETLGAALDAANALLSRFVRTLEPLFRLDLTDIQEFMRAGRFIY